MEWGVAVARQGRNAEIAVRVFAFFTVTASLHQTFDEIHRGRKKDDLMASKIKDCRVDVEHNKENSTYWTVGAT